MRVHACASTRGRVQVSRRPQLSWAGAGPWSRSISVSLGSPGSGRGCGCKAWMKGGSHPGEDAARVQQGHGGWQGGSGQRQSWELGKRPQEPRRGLLKGEDTDFPGRG